MKKNIIALLTISLILFCFFIDVYAECISGNCVNGYGISTITTSDNVEWKYEGKFKDGNHDGNGILYYNGKEFYDGQWKDGQRHGQGIWYYPNGKKFYEGQFKEDKKNGQGIQYDENGVKVYEGQWKDDNPLNADVVESKKDDIKQKTDCINIIKTHGFLTRAQFQCGFTSYNEDMMKAAKDCSAFLSENETKELLGTGMKLFDRNEKERGHDQLCQEILKDFPNIVRNEQNKPNSKVDNAKKEIVKGVISDYGCGDNCYLTITDAKGKEITGLCTAPLCQQWNENAEMPANFKGKKVIVTVGKGLQYDGEGNVMGETESFEKIDMLR